jgi:hypothetical protein
MIIALFRHREMIVYVCAGYQLALIKLTLIIWRSKLSSIVMATLHSGLTLMSQKCCHWLHMLSVIDSFISSTLQAIMDTIIAYLFTDWARMGDAYVSKLAASCSSNPGSFYFLALSSLDSVYCHLKFAINFIFSLFIDAGEINCDSILRTKKLFRELSCLPVRL